MPYSSLEGETVIFSWEAANSRDVSNDWLPASLSDMAQFNKVQPVQGITRGPPVRLSFGGAVV